jgi:hypothetical protein
MPSIDPQLLRAFLESHEARCPTCDYLLTGLHAGACPECGQQIRLAIDQGPILDTGPGPTALSLARVAACLIGLTSAIRAGVLFWFTIRVSGQTGASVWLQLVIHSAIVAASVAILARLRKHRAPHARTALAVRWALTLAIAAQASDALFLVLQLVRVRF